MASLKVGPNLEPFFNVALVLIADLERFYVGSNLNLLAFNALSKKVTLAMPTVQASLIHPLG